MRRKTLQFLSLVISSLVLLYLLFVNLYRESFFLSDWLVVAFDIAVKIVIEIALIVKKGNS